MFVWDPGQRHTHTHTNAHTNTHTHTHTHTHMVCDIYYNKYHVFSHMQYLICNMKHETWNSPKSLLWFVHIVSELGSWCCRISDYTLHTHFILHVTNHILLIITWNITYSKYSCYIPAANFAAFGPGCRASRSTFEVEEAGAMIRRTSATLTFFSPHPMAACSAV